MVRRARRSAKILDSLQLIVIEYLSAQAEQGAHILQLFEAMGDFITPDSFAVSAGPRMVAIAAELKRRHPSIPLMVAGSCWGSVGILVRRHEQAGLRLERVANCVGSTSVLR